MSIELPHGLGYYHITLHPILLTRLYHTSQTLYAVTNPPRSSFFGERTRSLLLTIKMSSAPVFPTQRKKERSLAAATEKLERAHFALLHLLCSKMRSIKKMFP